MHDFEDLERLDIPSFRAAQSKQPLRPYEYIFEEERWSSLTQGLVHKTIAEGWTCKSFPTLALSPPIAWDGICSHRTHHFFLHSWYFLGPILQMYDHTYGRKYLDFALNVTLDWISQYPSTTTQSPFAWYDVAIGSRAYRLAYLIDASVRVHDISDETIAQLLASACVHAEALSDDKRLAVHSNHGFYFAAGQLAQARRLSKLPGMDEAAQQAQERLQRLIRLQFTNEGGHREHSPNYHFRVFEAFDGLLESGLMEGAEFARLSDQIEEALAWFALPNGRLVDFGDSDQIRITDTKRLSPHNETLQFVVTGGREGRSPSTSTRVFPEAGYAVIRNGWPSGPENFADWSYLAQICGFHSNVHKHFDELSFVWYDHGHELLIDGGKYGYLYDDPNRIYVESTKAHSTVTVDGRSWAPRGSRKPYGSALLHSGEVAGTYYTETAVRHWKTVQHARVLVFRPGEWLIVFDWLSDDAGEPHDFTQRFLFAPELDAQAAGLSLTLTLPSGEKQLHMVPLLPADAITPVKGQREPEMLGWVSRKAGTMTPCWSGGFHVENKARHVFATLFTFSDEPPETFDCTSTSDESGRRVLLHWRQQDGEHSVAFFRPERGSFKLDYRRDVPGSRAWLHRQRQEGEVARIRYDLELFEQLNDEYRDHPIVDVAKTRERRRLLSPQLLSSTEVEGEPVTKAQRAQYAATNQLKPILRDLDLTGKVVMELGCGHGWLTAILPDQAGASKAIGVDIERYSSWPEHTDPRIELYEADLSKEQVVPAGTVDTVVSNVTFEHVSRPLQMLSALYDVLKDGGEAWLRMNLYTSRTASHKYSEIFFPWPHLLFEDEVCEEFYRKHLGKNDQRFAWVNHMTIAHYLRAVQVVGFEITRVGRSFVPIDLPFYLRFADKLGRYAALDLETDFLTLVLRKGEGDGDKARIDLDWEYPAREAELDRRILELIEGDAGGAPSQGSERTGGPSVTPAREPPQELSGSLPPRTIVSDQPISEAQEVPGSPENINTPGYWDRVYRREWESGSVFSATYERDYGPMHDAIISLIPRGANVLDVGCGPGVLCRKIKTRLPDTTVTGVDFSDYTIQRNKQVDQGLGNEYLRVDAQTELPLLEESFDAVILSEVIEHLDDPEGTIADAVGLLNPGGQLIITCPHDDAIPSTVHVRQWGHDELFHLLTAYSDTVCFTQFPPSHDKWMMAHCVKPS